jgi:uncharacterized membrane protein YfcA
VVSWLATALIGFASGVLSGMFGIGGGVVTTPALRLLLHTSELAAVGTPLPVIIPTAITGSIAYARRGLADLRVGLTVGAVGSLFAVAGAFGARRAGGRVVLVVTAALIVYMAMDMTMQALGIGGVRGARQVRSEPRTRPLGLVLLGILTGLYSGFLGLGGGFILVPMLTRWFRFPVKRALGTSLVAVGVLAIPGTITHYFLGNVDVRLAALLIIGVIPGALAGAHVTFGASDRFVRIGFAVLLAVVGLVLGVSELGWPG